MKIPPLYIFTSADLIYNPYATIVQEDYKKEPVQAVCPGDLILLRQPAQQRPVACLVLSNVKNGLRVSERKLTIFPILEPMFTARMIAHKHDWFYVSQGTPRST
jgi:hypothetical protein